MVPENTIARFIFLLTKTQLVWIKPLKTIWSVNFSTFITTTLCIFLFNSCKKSVDNEPTDTSLVVIKTETAELISTTSASIKSNILSDGGSKITERGACYSTSPDPTILSSRILSGNDTGSFTTILTGLSANTTYYVRAFATNSRGTTYGNQIHFITTPVDSAIALYIGDGDSLYALNAQTGIRKWAVELIPSDNYGHISTPAFWNGKVYVGCRYGKISGIHNYKLHAFDTSGILKWSVPIDGAQSNEGPIVKNGIVYIKTYSDYGLPNIGSLYAFNTETGALLWHISLPTVFGASNPIINNQMIYLNNSDYLYAIDASTGVTKWKYYTGTASKPLLVNGKLYVETSYTDRKGTTIHVLKALDANSGTVLWSKDPWIGGVPTLMSNGNLYCRKIWGNDYYAGVITCWDSSDISKNKWNSSRFNVYQRFILQDSILFAPSSLGIYAFNSFTGNYLWKASGDGGISSYTTMVNNTLYYSSNNVSGGMFTGGRVYAFDIKTRWYKWISDIKNRSFNGSTPCIVTRSGKVYRYGEVYN